MALGRGFDSELSELSELKALKAQAAASSAPSNSSSFSQTLSFLPNSSLLLLNLQLQTPRIAWPSTSPCSARQLSSFVLRPPADSHGRSLCVDVVSGGAFALPKKPAKAAICPGPSQAARIFMMLQTTTAPS